MANPGLFARIHRPTVGAKTEHKSGLLSQKKLIRLTEVRCLFRYFWASGQWLSSLDCRATNYRSRRLKGLYGKLCLCRQLAHAIQGGAGSEQLKPFHGSRDT